MTDGDAILAAILADPDEDTVRLAYADWLDEQGQGERAEFIRVQCELAALPVAVPVTTGNPILQTVADTFAERMDPHYGQRRRLRGREQELLTPANQRQWFPSFRLVAVADVGWYGGTYGLATARRGFVDVVACTAAAWLDHADRITAAHPVRSVTLTDEPAVEFDATTEENGYRASLFGRDEWHHFDSGSQHARTVAESLLKLAWPRIAFTLPPEPIQPMGYVTNAGSPNFADVSLEQLEVIVQQFILPPHLINPPG